MTLHINNESAAIILINTKQATKRSSHIDIQCFAIQDWQRQGHIIMSHVKGTNNPALMDSLRPSAGSHTITMLADSWDIVECECLAIHPS
jgi:hypothetical protein